MSTVLFVCGQNAGRSQMAQALFEQVSAGRHRALSAGTSPAAQIHPPVIEVMQEIGIDLTKRTPTLLIRELGEEADVIITMGCGDECPVIPGKQYIDWDLPDPARQPLTTVRQIRNEINTRVADLITRLDQPADKASD
ncbi:MAG TPA: arsenate reductase ArsC [Solirubrobacteraceae bacterium]|nr:arsenate reductase ArsC [Solirubrobacteraceae bacterium]